MIYGILIGLLIIIPIGIAYYYDYKQDPKEFKFSLKTLGKGIYKGLLYVLIYLGLNSVYEYIIPFNKKHGIEFNQKRIELGIPILEKNWSELGSKQFETIFWNPSMFENGHFKKIIEYGILDANTEIDYYRNLDRKETFAWSKYDFGTKTSEYFIEKPNDKTVSVSESGKLKFAKPTITEKVDKTEFENYLVE